MYVHTFNNLHSFKLQQSLGGLTFMLYTKQSLYYPRLMQCAIEVYHMAFFFLVFYIWSKFLQLTVTSHDLFQAEKKNTVVTS